MTAAAIRVFLVSPTRLYRDGLGDAIVRETGLELVGSAADARSELAAIESSGADVILLDGDGPDAIAAVRSVVEAAPELKVVALAMPEDEEELIAFAEAGISGYVSREASLDDLVAAVHSVARGEMICSPRAAATLLRRVTSLAAERPAPRARLTARQLEIVSLIEQGYTNKEIARCLCIEVPTVKNHLHNIFERLDVHRRSEAAARARGAGLAPAAARAREF